MENNRVGVAAAAFAAMRAAFSVALNSGTYCLSLVLKTSVSSVDRLSTPYGKHKLVGGANALASRASFYSLWET